MKEFDDERYKKYLGVIYKWNKTAQTHLAVRIYDIRSEIYSNETYYVFGIGVSDFLEDDGYDVSKDWTYDKKYTIKQQREMRDIMKGVAHSTKISLDDFSELNRLLKEAGAKKVFLHPAKYWYKKETQYNLCEQLVVIQDEEIKTNKDEKEK